MKAAAANALILSAASSSPAPAYSSHHNRVRSCLGLFGELDTDRRGWDYLDVTLMERLHVAAAVAVLREIVGVGRVAVDFDEEKSGALQYAGELFCWAMRSAARQCKARQGRIGDCVRPGSV